MPDNIMNEIDEQDEPVTQEDVLMNTKRSYSALKKTGEGFGYGALIPLGVFIILIIIGKIF